MVYTLGPQPGSTVERNHLINYHGGERHDRHGARQDPNAMYHDNGSGGWTDSQNVIEGHFERAANVRHNAVPEKAVRLRAPVSDRIVRNSTPGGVQGMPVGTFDWGRFQSMYSGDSAIAIVDRKKGLVRPGRPAHSRPHLTLSLHISPRPLGWG